MIEWKKPEPGAWRAEKILRCGLAQLLVASRACVERAEVQWHGPDQGGYMTFASLRLVDPQTGIHTEAQQARDFFWTVLDAQVAAEKWLTDIEAELSNAQPVTVYATPHPNAERHVALLSFEHNRRHINGWPIAMTSKIGSFLALVDTQGATCYVLPDTLGVSSDYNPGEIDSITVEYDIEDEPY